MDYCSSCRRHLNGALVCPGCGAYAPDIAPSAAGGPTVSAAPGPAAGASTEWETRAGAWFDGSFHEEPAPASLDAAPSGDARHGMARDGMARDGMVRDVATSAGGAQDAEGVPAAPQGRAARRRRRARWKKNQRRAVVATAVALVGGGLTLSAMSQQSGGRAQAATAPQQPDDGPAELQETELTRPASTPPRPSRTARDATPSADPTPTDVAREPAGASRAGREFTRPDAGAARPAQTSVPQSQSVSRPSGGTGSGSDAGSGADSGTGTGAGTGTGGGGGPAEQPQSPGTPQSGGSGSGTAAPPADPAPEETSPAQLCVLGVLCLG